MCIGWVWAQAVQYLLNQWAGKPVGVWGKADRSSGSLQAAVLRRLATEQARALGAATAELCAGIVQFRWQPMPGGTAETHAPVNDCFLHTHTI